MVYGICTSSGVNVQIPYTMTSHGTTNTCVSTVESVCTAAYTHQEDVYVKDFQRHVSRQQATVQQ